MDDVLNLINHLLTTEYSVDEVDSVIKHLKISREYLLQLIDDDRYKEFFQLLRPSNNRNQALEKLALTLDLFCCTHYGNQCKNESCPFLHLCPYNVRPMHTKCTNKTCPYDHDVLKSTHNRRIIDIRGLSWIPGRIFHELTRASADPNRSFWVCNEYGKKNGCSKKSSCDKLHFCYFSLIDGCTKPHCQHVINEACLSYFRRKELIEQDHEDILNAFRKVLRQRKPDFINKLNASNVPSAASKFPVSTDTQPKPLPSQQRGAAASATRLIPLPSTRESAAYDEIFSSRPDFPLPEPEHEKDIILLASYDEDEYEEIERFLSDQIECPIKLIACKNIFSESKEKLSSTLREEPAYYYCPTKKPEDIFQFLRWQNAEKRLSKPLIVYPSLRDAHDAAEQNLSNNQFCIFRVHILRSGALNEKLSSENHLELTDPSIICFDRMWIYIYNL